MERPGPDPSRRRNCDAAITLRCLVRTRESLRLWRDQGRLWSPDSTCLVYVDELDQWADFDRVRVIPSVDPGGQTPDWKSKIGFG